MTKTCAFAVYGVLLAGITPASAQTTPRVEVTVGGVLAGATTAGDINATLLDSGNNPLVLFRTSNRIATGSGVEGLVSLRLRNRWLVELGGTWVKTDLESRITGDLEDVPPLTATVGLHQITVEASLVYRLARRGRWDPFTRVGGGWLRELTTGRALATNGFSGNVSGGIKYWMRESGPGLFGRLAIRAEARLQVRRGGITFGERATRVSPTFAVGLVIGR
ncbi:MAG: hypothetical protein HQ485_16740 [Acidobacteria bacterium]|jgi:hypothetical protein|nr:hypothetical protein [Acidobacteriota bacterium]